MNELKWEREWTYHTLKCETKNFTIKAMSYNNGWGFMLDIEVQAKKDLESCFDKKIQFSLNGNDTIQFGSYPEFKTLREAKIVAEDTISKLKEIFR